jgi:hypothetical protein
VTVPIIEIPVGIFSIIGQAGGNVTLPISIGDTTDLGIGAAVMHLTYDPDILTPVDANTEGTIASDWDVAYDIGGAGTSSILHDSSTIQEAGEGHIVIALAGYQELSGSGNLVNVIFDVSDDAVEGQTSPIQLSDISLSSGDPDEVNGNAEFEVGEPISTQLGIGWNLISLPLQPPNPDPSAVLSSIAGTYSSVWAYNPNTGWSVYTPDGISDLNELKPGDGYWIRMHGTGTLNFQGNDPQSTEIPLEGGEWNLVGYSSRHSRDIEDCMQGVADYINSVWAYDPNTGWSVYAPDGVSDLDVMNPGYGYWIKADQKCDWDINAP